MKTDPKLAADKFVQAITIALLAGELEKVCLQLQWKHQFEFAGFYAAQERGYYTEAGLDVELVEFDNGVNSIQRVLDGDVQFAVGYS